MIMMKKSSNHITMPCWVILFTVCFCFFYVHANEIGHYGNFDDEEGGGGGGGGSAVGAGGGTFLVKRDQRRLIVSTEYGQISAVKIPTSDGRKGITGSYYNLHFITLEPNALLLPLLLHADMLFYVNTGSASLSYVDYDEDKNELQHIDLSRGDVYRLQAGTLFFIQSNLETERQKLRIYAIFANSNENSQEITSIKAYSSVQDLLLGFDKRVLQAAFNVPEDVITELKSGQPQPLIVHGVQKAKKNIWEVEAHLMRSLLGSRNYGMFDFSISNKGKKNKVFNILKAKPDVENCNGWSLSVTKKQSKALKQSDMGVFMVNLTKGSMMGPHWNPMATEIGVVLQGRGMIRIVCSRNTSETGCGNMRFRVEEGDVFAIPRFHPMAQISFNNESLVFMGFTTASKNNHPQFLAGKRSVLQTLDKLVLAASFQVSNETIERLLAPQEESIILECTSCAENEEAVMEEEIERGREEERRREEEEGRKREEEKRREEEEARKREEEEAKRREEEKRRREEEQEEEARRKEKEEAARKREEARRREEEKRKREEASRKEEERRKHEAEQEEEAARRQEEEARQQEEERERQEEEASRKQEEEAARQQEEERERRQEEEAQRREEKRRKREAEQEEEAARKQEEEAARQQEEEKERRQEEEAQRREEKRRKREAEQEEEAARKQEEEAARQQEEEKERQQEEEAQRREEKRRKREAEQEAAAARKQEEEAARQQEEERERRQEEEGEAGHGEQEEEEGEEAAARREDEERQKRAAEEEAEARERETEEGEGRRIPRRFRRV